MNTLLWILQGFLALTFLYSGVCKSLLAEKTLVKMGQTGVEGLSPFFIKGIGISEILGATGLVVPEAFNIAPVLTPVSALCLALIMPFAAVIHYKRREYRSVVINVVVFCLCIFVAFARVFFYR
ncbi:MAG TPA: DoxX family protein [Chitinophaga sp.]|uniref:DoxX family protein n=1 Tax=Chitinophaga sp. TaxID=1869181 RepID=UPI002DB70046|nr:DoxX family protein [Chitinophaga sp.]HEU4555179.1 DoxX family protein [Chitinophaga sp.]